MAVGGKKKSAIESSPVSTGLQARPITYPEERRERPDLLVAARVGLQHWREDLVIW